MKASRPHMPGYGLLGPNEGRGLLPWSWAQERLRSSRSYRLSTVNPSGRPRTAAAILKLGATGIAPATAAAKRGDMETAIRSFGAAVLGREAFRQLSPARREQVRNNSFPAEFLGSGFSSLDPDSVRNVRTPTLLITGQHSPAIFHRLTEALVELLPNVERTEIDAASHIMHEDNPSAYHDAVLSFLARQSQAPRQPIL